MPKVIIFASYETDDLQDQINTFLSESDGDNFKFNYSTGTDSGKIVFSVLVTYDAPINTF